MKSETIEPATPPQQNATNPSGRLQISSNYSTLLLITSNLKNESLLPLTSRRFKLMA